MKILYTKSNWEAGHLSLPQFLEAVKKDGFDGTEVFLPPRTESPAEIRRLHEQAGLGLIGQIITEGRSLAEHLKTLEERYLKAVDTGAWFVNCHSGRDIFSFDDNLRVFERAQSLSAKQGVPLLHETHRGRALFTGPDTARYLKAVPGLRLTTDFSHWFCVHESDLADQEENLSAAIAASSHIHARVGFCEGPQVGDPRGPSYKFWLDRHLEIWRRIIAARKADGWPRFTLTPEFGPAPYMPLIPLEDRPVADTWEVNCWMRGLLLRELGREV